MLGRRLFGRRLGGLLCRLQFGRGGCFRLGNGLLGDDVAFIFSHHFLLYLAARDSPLLLLTRVL